MAAPVPLTHAVELEELQTIPDGLGGQTESWAVLGMLWAAFEPGTGGETADAAVARARVPWRVVVRGAPVGAPSRPRPGQRFRLGARRFRILAVAERDRRGARLTCFTEQEEPSA